MDIAVLDRASLGEDTPLDALFAYGKVRVYDKTDVGEIMEHIGDASIIIINKVKITESIIEKSPKLKLICLFATGYDNVDIKAATKHGVAVCNVPGYSTDSVALLCSSIVLSLATHLTEYSEYVKNGSYTKSGVPNKLTPIYHELRGKTWGILGYGNIGRAVGRVAEALGMRLIACKKTPVDMVRCVDVETLCRESDVLTLHCPLNEETKEIINKRTISMMKKSIILVNMARGAVVNENDVATAICNWDIGAFGSDVYTVEPFDECHPYNLIKDKPNVILTPHTAWGSYESRCRCLNIICSNIDAFIKGKTLNRVDI